jgi:exopolyphosphatase/guanosine-5'-triphosphate,3'-diphosphate pyrophosphatase
MLGRGGVDDPRDASIDALMHRYGSDRDQAQRVEHTALRLFDQVAAKWSLGEDERRMLVWAARVHELGLAIAHSQYHVHGAYILEHSDIAGFSRQEQLFLAALVRNHRRNVSNKSLEALPDRLLAQARRCAAVLRLAVLLHRSHEAESIPKLEVRASGNAIVLSLSKSWLDERPLLRSDLEHEPEGIAGLAIDLFIED